MNKTNKKRALIASVAAFALVAGTYAMYISKFNVDNKFAVHNPDAKFVETFTPPAEDETIFGEDYEKTGYVDNTASTSAVKARVKIVAGWVDKDKQNDKPGETISNIFPVYDADGITLKGYDYAATLDFDTVDDSYVILGAFKNEQKPGLSADLNTAIKTYATTGGSTLTSGLEKFWQYDADGYFYYGGKDGIIAAGESSNKILKQVTFNKQLSVAVRKTAIYKVENDITISKGVDSTYKADGYASQAEAVARIAYLKDCGVQNVGKITYEETTTFAKDSNGNSYDKTEYVVTLTV